MTNDFSLRMERQNRHYHFAAVSFALGLMIGLGGLEVAARIFDLAPLPEPYSAFARDDVLPWKLKPNRIIKGERDEFRYRYEHNALGFRGRDHKIEKEPGTFRIVGIGDSFTYGIGADEDSTFLARIEISLAGRWGGGGGKVEVINLGIPRYWPEPEALVLEHYGLYYQPDLVLVGVLPNDFVDTRIGTNVPRVRNGYLISSRARRLGAIGQWLYIHSHVARVVIAYVFVRDHGQHDNKTDPESGMEDDEAVWAHFHQAHDRMVQLARGAGAQIVFVHIPQRGPWGPWSADALDMPKRIRHFCATRECSVIDVLPAMIAHPNPDMLYYPKDSHCTPAGYEIVADVIVRELESQGLLPEELQAGGAASAAMKERDNGSVS